MSRYLAGEQLLAAVSYQPLKPLILSVGFHSVSIGRHISSVHGQLRKAIALESDDGGDHHRRPYLDNAFAVS
jgi:hypothetical protein